MDMKCITVAYIAGQKFKTINIRYYVQVRHFLENFYFFESALERGGEEEVVSSVGNHKNLKMRSKLFP